jgi:hypothetical protein
MEQQEISHKEIYDRLLVVEQAVAELKNNTADIVTAFNAAKGAFTVLEWIAKVAKPLMVIGAFLAGAAAYWSHK